MHYNARLADIDRLTGARATEMHRWMALRRYHVNSILARTVSIVYNGNVAITNAMRRLREISCLHQVWYHFYAFRSTMGYVVPKHLDFHHLRRCGILFPIFLAAISLPNALFDSGLVSILLTICENCRP